MYIGSIRTWLNIHTHFGIIGFIMVMLHAGFPFKFRYSVFSAGTVSTYLMIITVLSGFTGRHIYRHMDERGRRIFKYWRAVHVSLLAILFFSVAIHIAVP